MDRPAFVPGRLVSEQLARTLFPLKCDISICDKQIAVAVMEITVDKVWRRIDTTWSRTFLAKKVLLHVSIGHID